MFYRSPYKISGAGVIVTGRDSHATLRMTGQETGKSRKGIPFRKKYVAERNEVTYQKLNLVTIDFVLASKF